MFQTDISWTDTVLAAPDADLGEQWSQLVSLCDVLKVVKGINCLVNRY